MSFDDVLETKIKPLGRWQILLFFIIAITNHMPFYIIPQLANLGTPFICSGPWFSGMIFEEVSSISMKIADLSPTINGSSTDFACQRFDLSSLNRTLRTNMTVQEREEKILSFSASTNLTLEKCPGPWLYDVKNAPYRETLIKSFNLVCDRAVLIPNSAVFSIIGQTIGVVLGGELGDRFGRRMVICIFYPLLGIAAMSVVFCQNFFAFLSLRFIVGLFQATAYCCGFVLIIELTNKKHRNTLNVGGGLIYTVIDLNAYILCSWLIQDWRWVHFVFGAVTFVLSICLIIFVPESPRWLIARGRYEEALKVVRQAIRVNGGSKELAESVTEEDIRDSDVHVVKPATDDTLPCGQKVCRAFRAWLRFFILPQSIRRLILLSLIWFSQRVCALGMKYYGVRLPGNPYLIAFVMVMCTLPPNFIAWLLYFKFDRKKPLIGMLMFVCLVTTSGYVGKMFALSSIFVIVMASLSGSVLSAAVDMLFVYTPELFPTLFRGKALGYCVAMSRAGGIAAMYIERFPGNWPLFTFSVSVGVAALCSIFLPVKAFKISGESDSRSSSCLEPEANDKPRVEQDIELKKSTAS